MTPNKINPMDAVTVPSMAISSASVLYVYFFSLWWTYTIKTYWFQWWTSQIYFVFNDSYSMK